MKEMTREEFIRDITMLAYNEVVQINHQDIERRKVEINLLSERFNQNLLDKGIDIKNILDSGEFSKLTPEEFQLVKDAKGSFTREEAAELVDKYFDEIMEEIEFQVEDHYEAYPESPQFDVTFDRDMIIDAAIEWTSMKYDRVYGFPEYPTIEGVALYFTPEGPIEVSNGEAKTGPYELADVHKCVNPSEIFPELKKDDPTPTDLGEDGLHNDLDLPGGL